MSWLVDTFVVRKAHFRGAAIIRHSISPEQSRWTRRKFPRSCGSLSANTATRSVAGRATTGIYAHPSASFLWRLDLEPFHEGGPLFSPSRQSQSPRFFSVAIGEQNVYFDVLFGIVTASERKCIPYSSMHERFGNGNARYEIL